ncbi:MAG: hypothetical protein ACYC26_13175 [Phycisphaerales bacterium]
MNRHAGDETPRAQQLFRQSLQAAFTADELRKVIDVLQLHGADVVIDTDRHVSIQSAGKTPGGPPHSRWLSGRFPTHVD